MPNRQPPAILDTTSLDGEEWRPVPGYEGMYEVSNLGRVKSLGTSRNRPPTILRICVKQHGYRYAALHQAGRRRCPTLHRVVLEAFVGPCPDGREGCHIDDDKSNNHLSNLYWGTRSDNMLDRIRHGNNPQSSKTHCVHGHPFDEANTYWRDGGRHRVCRICMKAHAAKTNAKKRQRRAMAKRTKSAHA